MREPEKRITQHFRLGLMPVRLGMVMDALLVDCLGSALDGGTMPLGEIPDAAMIGFPGRNDEFAATAG